MGSMKLIIVVLVVAMVICDAIPAPGRGGGRRGRGRGRQGRQRNRQNRRDIVRENCAGEDDVDKVFKIDCNWCTCSNRPGLAACTMMLCPKPGRRPPVKACGNHTVGEAYFDGCNTCSCTPVGPLCTMRECLDDALIDDESQIPDPDVEEDREKRSISDETIELIRDMEEVEISESKRQKRWTSPFPRKHCHGRKEEWRMSCNTCWCTQQGFPICTMRYCNDDFPFRNKRSTVYSHEHQVKLDLQTRLELLMICGPDREIGDSWNDGCNLCGCTAYGPICTMRYCLSPQLQTENNFENFEI
ncbi:unnamed protein product [Owenia fusiformis]|uniref:Uncharacterized protein n=1 Tax=Owenia fusiformis TaxID=6347 RepID=A0A8J1XWQ8_OWEFU|nr:unnamed protein product [Owenia fusiformis]